MCVLIVFSLADEGRRLLVVVFGQSLQTLKSEAWERVTRHKVPDENFLRLSRSPQKRETRGR